MPEPKIDQDLIKFAKKKNDEALAKKAKAPANIISNVNTGADYSSSKGVKKIGGIISNNI